LTGTRLSVRPDTGLFRRNGIAELHIALRERDLDVCIFRALSIAIPTSPAVRHPESKSSIQHKTRTHPIRSATTVEERDVNKKKVLG
jgi:hypothetical protein